MEKLNYFNYCALVVLLVVFVSTILRKMVTGKLNRYFLYILLLCIVTTSFDIWAITLDNLNTSVGLRYFVHAGYLLSRNLLMPLLTIYVIGLTDMWHKIKKYRLLAETVKTPLYITIIAILTNYFTDFVFYFDESGAYTRGEGFVLLYVSAAVYTVYSFVHIIKHANYFSRRILVSLLTVYPLMVGAVIFQFFYPMYPVEMFVTAIAMLFVSVMIQRPEERLDIVTNLYKFNAYMSDIKRAFASKKPINIIMINILNYYSINELIGYDKMHEMLHEVAKNIRAFDKRQELGADLYYIERGRFRMVIDSDHFKQTDWVAEQLGNTLRNGIVINDMHINLSLNLCIAECPEDVHDFDKLMALGDNLGKIPEANTIQRASDLIKNMHYELMKDIDCIIEDALANRKFEVYYQPIYSVYEEKFNSAEALIRLNHEKFGFISPEILITAAEKNGAIHRVGEYVLEEVCKFISSKEYKELGLEYIEINLSVVQCMQKELSRNIIKMLEKYNVLPEQINLEITETAASYSQNIMADNIGSLSEKGIDFSLDDFGTGYSNMRRIALLPLKIVKLDKSFTTIDENPKLMIILQNTIKMIKEMNMKIVVEGIENENLVKQFSNLQCEYIQGYYFSKPIPKDEFIRFIKNSQIPANR